MPSKTKRVSSHVALCLLAFANQACVSQSKPAERKIDEILRFLPSYISVSDSECSYDVPSTAAYGKLNGYKYWIISEDYDENRLGPDLVYDIAVQRGSAECTLRLQTFGIHGQYSYRKDPPLLRVDTFIEGDAGETLTVGFFRQFTIIAGPRNLLKVLNTKTAKS